MQESNNCEKLLLTSLTTFYDNNPKYKNIFKEIIEGNHKLSLRLIDWLVTHYSKSKNSFYWINKNNDIIYFEYPELKHDTTDKDIKKINIYLDYRAQLKSYAKINFDSFRRHNRITFVLNDKDIIETTIGQLNFFRWIFNSKILQYALLKYNDIYKDMIKSNEKKKKKKITIGVQDITKVMCTLRFD